MTLFGLEIAAYREVIPRFAFVLTLYPYYRNNQIEGRFNFVDLAHCLGIPARYRTGGDVEMTSNFNL
jgi:hypothetical protein